MSGIGAVQQMARERALALGKATFLPGSPQKRFAKDISRVAEEDPDYVFSYRQVLYLERLAYRFRRQMPHRLVPLRDPGPMPYRHSLPTDPTPPV